MEESIVLLGAFAILGRQLPAGCIQQQSQSPADVDVFLLLPLISCLLFRLLFGVANWKQQEPDLVPAGCFGPKLIELRQKHSYVDQLKTVDVIEVLVHLRISHWELFDVHRTEASGFLLKFGIIYRMAAQSFADQLVRANFLHWRVCRELAAAEIQYLQGFVVARYGDKWHSCWRSLFVFALWAKGKQFSTFLGLDQLRQQPSAPVDIARANNLQTGRLR